MNIFSPMYQAKLYKFFFILFFITSFQTLSSQTLNIYISNSGNDTNSGLSPQSSLATLNEAFRKINADKAQCPINILLSGGIYSISEPLRLLPENSGQNGNSITIQPIGKEEVIFNGSKPIQGWKKLRKNIWYTVIPEVKNGNWKFRQLFVNGKPRTLARFPNEGFYQVTGFPDGGTEVHYHKDSKRFQFRAGDIDPGWSNLSDVRLIVYHFWSDAHMQIDSINTINNIVTFKYPADKRFTDDFTTDGAKYIVENVFEGLDEPGEWYLNYHTGVIYYIPLEGENLINAKVEAPYLGEFIQIKGDAKKLNIVENIHFKDITFKYTNFMLSEGDQGDMQAAHTVPAAITIEGSSNCSFNGCKLIHLGTYAFEVKKGCSNISFTNNSILNTAAGGFKVNGGDETDHPLERTKDILISDNDLGYYGEGYPSAVGILLMNTEGNYIVHNNIHHGWYTGISVGWRWGYERSISRDNIIEYNHIHHIGQGLLSDMGAIYTLGVSPGTIIRNNLIHDVESNKYGGWGIYNDEGSSHLLIENNIVYNTKYAAYNMHFAKEITVRNNIFAFGKLEELNRTKGEPHTSVYFENNIIYWNSIKDPFTADWKDQPYKFHVNPWREEQPIKTTNFDTDYNIFFNPEMPLDSITFNGNSWEKWQAMGKDKHSLYCDPMFTDPSKFNFELKVTSPAFKLGFKPIDISTVGVRRK